MKTRLAAGALIFLLFIARGATLRAEDPAFAAHPPPRELTIVVVESLRGSSIESSIYDRISRVFTRVFEDQKWPLTLRVERFAANTPAHPTELRIFFEGLRSESYGDLTFRAWMTLYDRGAKKDFGIILYRYDTRAGEQMDDRMDRAVRGAALVAAEDVQSVLFPEAGHRKH